MDEICFENKLSSYFYSLKYLNTYTIYYVIRIAQLNILSDIIIFHLYVNYYNIIICFLIRMYGSTYHVDVLQRG